MGSLLHRDGPARIALPLNELLTMHLPECQLFGTLGCHLCEQAEAVVLPLVENGLLVELLDIAERPDWFDNYGLRIPVLRRVDTGAELDWPFEVEQVVWFLRS
ncbi:thiol-disulfide isomerase and thioredoxin [Pseudomonas sp. MT-1]|nr:thiol-disulfide isomerase and thioredoxin [Pseudomonas sp. MT-1]